MLIRILAVSGKISNFPIPYSSDPTYYRKTLNNQQIASYKLSGYKTNAGGDSHSNPSLLIQTPHLAKASISKL